jgi:hypothetical protein
LHHRKDDKQPPPTTQGDPGWPIVETDHFAVGTPPDIIEGDTLNDYLMGVEAGLEFAYEDTPKESKPETPPSTPHTKRSLRRTCD